MILEYKNYIKTDFVEEIRDKVKPFINQTKQTTMYNRDGITVNITKTSELQELDFKINSVFRLFSNDVLNQRFRPQCPSGDSGYEYHLYKPGDMCHHHSDGELSFSTNNTSLLRYATVILFLTDNDDGELVFPSQNIEIKPEKGKIVAFPPYGFFSHYAKPSVKDREILMTWFVYNGIMVHKNAN